MKSVAVVLWIAFSGLMIGATVLSGFLGGMKGVIAGPVFALFGWFYLVPVLIFTCGMWFLFVPSWSAIAKIFFVVFSSLFACVMMFFIGVRSLDAKAEWVVGYCSGGFVAGLSCALQVAWFRSKMNETHESKQPALAPGDADDSNPYRSPRA